jgi:hypothetical protein
MKTKSGKKRMVWTGYVNEHWEVTSGYSGTQFILCEMSVIAEKDDKRVRVTVETL